MPFYEGIGLIAEKNAVVLDVGASVTKAGFAGEYAPRAVLRTPKEAFDSQMAPELLYDCLVSFVHEIYFQRLLVNPKDKRVVVVDHILGPAKLKTLLSRVLFRHFEVLSVLYAPSPLLPLLTLGTSTGLVLDLGHREATVLPVVEGVTVLKAWQALPLGGAAVEAALEAAVREKATVKDRNGTERKVQEMEDAISPLTPSLLEDLKVRLCFCTSLERGRQIQDIARDASSVSGLSSFLKKSVPTSEYPLRDGEYTLQIDGSIRESVFEVLFEQDQDRLSVPTMVLDAIAACPLDTRRTLAANLVIIGGTSMIPGFKARLFQELQALLQSEERYKEKLNIPALKLHAPPVKANLVSWTGASLLGATDYISTRSFTRDDYMKNKGAVPDWADFRFNTVFGEEGALLGGKQG